MIGRLLTRRRLAPAALALGLASGFAPRATTPILCNRQPDRFFASQQGGGDDEAEVARLRRENAALKKRLGRDGDEPSSSFFDGVAKFFGKKEETALEKQQAQMGREIDEVFKGGGLLGSLVGSVAKGVVGMASKAMAETAADMDSALRAVERALRPQLGDDVVVDPPMQQAYSSSSINGAVRKQVQCVATARGSKGAGTVRFVAVIDGGGNVDITSLDLDGRDVPAASRPGSRKGEGVIIDV